MKTKTFFSIAVAIATSMMFANCNSSSNESSTSNSDAKEVVTNSSDESDYWSSSSNVERSSSSSESTYAGTYSFSDSEGTQWKVVLKNDESAVLYRNGSDIDYGTWSTCPYDFPAVTFSDPKPYIVLPDGETDLHAFIYVKEGYIYTSTTAAQGNHPKKRLKYTKTK